MSKNFIELIDEYTIIVPLIQRDYAQGRKDEKVKANKFLKAIKDGLKDGLNLDFIYGKTDEGIFIPLDGQQRLTTLFLLHWYSSLEDKYIIELSKFSYKVRSSTKDFIKALTEEKNWAKLTKLNIKNSIENSNWFFLSWKNDPTVLAILNMFNIIENIFKDTKIEEFNSITFELLRLDKFNLTDELYVKMNARGKPLTEFENFKAEFEKYIKDDITKAKLDNQWLDIFWGIGQSKVKNIVNAPKLADEMFYNFFYNITFNFYLENLKTLNCEINDKNKEFNKIEDFIKECSIFDFYKNVYAEDKNIKKIISILDNLHVDKEFKIFIEKKEISQWERARFYALCLGYINNLDEKEFSRWKKVSFNLINNQLIQSPDNLINTIQSLNKLITNSNHNIYAYIKDDSKKISYFSAIQRDEESLKATLIEKNIDWEKELKLAEDNWYLNGQVGFLLSFSDNKIDSFKEYRDKFNSLWKFAQDDNNQVYIYQALLTKGNYLPKLGSNHTFCSFDEKSIRIKNDNWRKVFNSDKLSSTEDNPQRNLYLKSLLDDSKFNISDIGTSLNKIISSYAFKCVNPLSFFIAYPSYIKYCKKLQIRWYGKNEIYLLKTTQMNGLHAELYTYDLYKKEFEDKTLAPFEKSEYHYTNSWEPPCVSLRGWEVNKLKYQLDIFYENGKYKIYFYEENDKLMNTVLVNILINNGFVLNSEKFYILETTYECSQNDQLIEFLEKLVTSLKYDPI